MDRRDRVADGELLEGTLRCTGCARTYPVAGGIPVVLADSGGVDLQALRATPETLLADASRQPESAPLVRALIQLSTYLDASWGDRAEPPPDGPGARFGFAELAARLRGLPKVDAALELGCGAGRGVFELRADAAEVVGLDGNPWLLGAARTLFQTGQLLYPRRILGRDFGLARIAAPPRSGIELVCGDALAPPFAPGTFGRVAALNLLDNVRSPRVLLHELQQLSNGDVLLSAPYAFREGIVEEGERLNGPEAVHAELARLGLTVEEEALRLRWTLRHDARAATVYDVHWVRSRKS